MKCLAVVLALLTLTRAHYHFFSLTYNGVQDAKWEHVRQINHDGINFPELDVHGPNMTCNRPEPGAPAPKTLNVTAGSTITFNSYPVFHQGPLNFYMAKVPQGKSIDEFDGKGTVFFKVSSDTPSIINDRLTWPNQDKTEHNVTIPKCIEDGDYLLRVEHVALHAASTVGGAQFYMSCAHIRVSGGSATYKPNLLSFPGSYNATDPSIYIHIWHPIPTNYTAPGGPALSC